MGVWHILAASIWHSLCIFELQYSVRYRIRFVNLDYCLAIEKKVPVFVYTMPYDIHFSIPDSSIITVFFFETWWLLVFGAHCCIHCNTAWYKMTLNFLWVSSGPLIWLDDWFSRNADMYCTFCWTKYQHRCDYSTCSVLPYGWITTMLIFRTLHSCSCNIA